MVDESKVWQLYARVREETFIKKDAFLKADKSYVCGSCDPTLEDVVIPVVGDTKLVGKLGQCNIVNYRWFDYFEWAQITFSVQGPYPSKLGVLYDALDQFYGKPTQNDGKGRSIYVQKAATQQVKTESVTTFDDGRFEVKISSDENHDLFKACILTIDMIQMTEEYRSRKKGKDKPAEHIGSLPEGWNNLD